MLISSKSMRWLVPLLVLHSGIFVALASPQRPIPLVWVGMLVPMFLALDLALRWYQGPARWRWGRVLACTYPAGVVFAAITGDWVTNTAHVFGALPLPLAYAVTWFGYGSLFGLEFFFYLGVPFALSWRRPWLCLALVPLWATVGQLYVPRFLFFTYGQGMFTTPQLVQTADTLGSGGLNLLLLPLQLVLYCWLRRLYAPAELPLKRLAALTGGLAVLFAATYGYGHWQKQVWAKREAAGPQVELVGIQPNFSLKHLASNPALAPSQRVRTLQALLADSAQGLRRAAREPGVPTVLVWPESVYPRPFFAAGAMGEAVQRWVRLAGVDLILATQDNRYERNRQGKVVRKAFGGSVHIGADGALRGLYHKIALIPFGETIPFASWFPFYRRLVLAAIPNISEFARGSEFTVFRLENGVKVAPMICFDAADESVARGMARNGARLGVLQANLAWFGPTTVSNQFGWFARFRAIENRMPILFLSQNGESFMLDSRGQESSARLPQFESGVIVQRVGVPRQGAFYTEFGDWVNRAYLLLLAAVALAGLWRHIPKRGAPRGFGNQARARR